MEPDCVDMRPCDVNELLLEKLKLSSVSTPNSNGDFNLLFELLDESLLSFQIDVAKSRSMSGTPLYKIPFTVKNIEVFPIKSIIEVKEEYFDTKDLDLLSQNMWLKLSSIKGWSLKEKVGSTPRDTLIQYENYVDRENIRNHLAQKFSGIFTLETYFRSLLQFKVLRHFINDQCYIDKLMIDEKPYLFGSCFCSFCQHIDPSMKLAPTKVVYLLWKNDRSVFDKITPLLSKRGTENGFVVHQQEETLTELIRKSNVSVTQPILTKEFEQRMQKIKKAGPSYFFEEEGSDEESNDDNVTT